MNTFFLIIQDAFLQYFLLPLSNGSLFKIGLMFSHKTSLLIAKLIGIFIALSINFLAGLLFAKIVRKKSIVHQNHYFASILCVIPIASSFVSFALGTGGNYIKFILISMTSVILYYSFAIFFPVILFF